MTEKREQKINIAMVGYYNTLPFLYGLKKSDTFNLILDTPSKCMDYYTNRKADIALVPIVTLLDRSDYNIVTGYCIGCVGAVRTVCLFFNGNIEDVTKIYLDKDSRTSQLLVKILCKESWNIQPNFIECNVRNICSEELDLDEAVLMIGDKVFDMEDAFQNSYDLGIEWQNLTGLPFVFAVWIARKDIDDSIVEEMNIAIGQGVDDIDAVLKENNSIATKINLSEYFSTYIDFHFDINKKEALRQFSEFNMKMFSNKPKNLTVSS